MKNRKLLWIFIGIIILILVGSFIAFNVSLAPSGSDEKQWWEYFFVKARQGRVRSHLAAIIEPTITCETLEREMRDEGTRPICDTCKEANNLGCDLDAGGLDGPFGQCWDCFNP